MGSSDTDRLEALAAATYAAERDPLSDLPWGPHLLPGKTAHWLARAAAQIAREEVAEELTALAADRDRLGDELRRAREATALATAQRDAAEVEVRRVREAAPPAPAPDADPRQLTVPGADAPPAPPAPRPRSKGHTDAVAALVADSESGISITDLSTRTGLAPKLVRQICSLLGKRGKARSLGGGVWCRA